MVKQGGPGAILLTFYIALSTYIWYPELTKTEILLPATAVSFLLAYIIAIYSDEIIGFLHWPTLIEVYSEVNESGEGNAFYFDHRENWEKLDDYDNKVYRNTVAIVAGIIIAISLPIQGLAYAGIWMGAVCFGGSLFSIAAFVYKPYIHSRETIMTTVNLYD